MAIKKIQTSDIEPFNDCFFYNCFHSALFSIIRANGGNYMEYLANGIPYISTQAGEYSNRILERLLFIEEYEKMFKRHGFFVDRIEDEEYVLKFLHNALGEGSPVILSVDGWYLTYRIDFYHIVHWPHSLLVMEYNEEKQKFEVIDQPVRDDMKFTTWYISEKDIKEAVWGFAQMRKKDILFSGNLALSFKVIHEAKSSDKQEIKEKWKKNHIFSRDVVKAGIEVMEQQESYFKNFLSNKNNVLTGGRFILDGFNDIVLQKKWENLLVNYLFQKEDKISLLSNQILNHWTIIRNYVGHIVLSKKEKPSTILRFCEDYRVLAQLEKKYEKTIIQEM